MRRRRRMSASARATVRRWALSSLHGAALLGVPAVAVAAECPPLLPQPAATNPRTTTASARAPVADGAAAGKGNRDILTELSGSPAPASQGLPSHPTSVAQPGPLRQRRLDVVDVVHGARVVPAARVPGPDAAPEDIRPAVCGGDLPHRLPVVEPGT